MRETGKFSVYSGLNNVKIDEKITMNAYFVTYVSTSWRKSVCKAFMKGTGQKKAEGMIIEFDAGFKDLVACCDVSWISKFPGECEVLFSRQLEDFDHSKFNVVVLDESDGVQTVSLKPFQNILLSRKGNDYYSARLDANKQVKEEKVAGDLLQSLQGTIQSLKAKQMSQMQNDKGNVTQKDMQRLAKIQAMQLVANHTMQRYKKSKGTKNSLQCPGNHMMRHFNVTTDTYKCDGCAKIMAVNSKLWGCRACNYDLCGKCYGND